MARPTKYSEPLVSALCAIIETGCTIRLACDSVGITTETYNQWTKSNLEFADAVKRARATGAQNLLSDIKTAARSGTWQAAAWILERSYHEHYGRMAPIPAPEPENAELTKLDLLLAAMHRETHTPDSDEQPSDDTEIDHEPTI
ncbi:MAG: hypothetical protein ACYC1M_04075 [Armatimonadota bacterium]